MNHLITVEGDPQAVRAEDGETILDALLRNGVGFAYSCQAGNCGTCKCEYVSGEIYELEYSEHALSAAERARNVILACRTQVWGDTQIRRLSVEEFVMHPSRIMQCRVTELAPLTHDVYRLRLAIESGGPYTFSAGQFAKLQFAFAPDAPRDYSMANPPHVGGLEFHFRVTPGGVSQRIPGEVKAGDLVRVSGPFGTAYLREQHAGPILLVAGGTGLAPVRAILLAALNRGMKQPMYLYFGVRAERDVYGEPELRALEAKHPNLKVHVVVSEQPVAGVHRIGMVTDALAADLADLSGFQVYMAGPPAMVDAATELAALQGVQPRDMHADAFYGAAEQASQLKRAASA
jgi:CDP-4-dehydro-6-deoxyglucose reductase/ferredoxin-NAD(P)+ reductase (naphthalene dioxygenase ferredoxin-specific)